MNFDKLKKPLREPKKRNQQDEPIREIVHGIQVSGNKHGNYLKIGRFSNNDNRLFIEIGDCCVVTFRGFVTVEALTSFLTKCSFENNDGLLKNIRNKMRWNQETNDEFFKGSEELGYFEQPYFENIDNIKS